MKRRSTTLARLLTFGVNLLKLAIYTILCVMAKRWAPFVKGKKDNTTVIITNYEHAIQLLGIIIIIITRAPCGRKFLMKEQMIILQ